MISSILLLSQKGDILILRAYKDNVSRAECQTYCDEIVAPKEHTERPIHRIRNTHFIHITVGEVSIVAATKDNVNVVLVIKLLYKIKDLFIAYFQILDEAHVRRHLTLIYELLDEIVDYGYPQILEADILKKYITQSGTKSIDLNNAEELKRITVQATGNTSWRAEGIRYKKNEVYIDVVENVNVLYSARGNLLGADVVGQIMVKCLLSGMPECKFGMNDKLVMNSDANAPGGSYRHNKAGDKGIAIDDCRFHQCVRLSKFDVERTITFVPPDGVFELMSYRITENINCPFKIIPVVQERGRSRLECSVKIKGIFERNVAAQNVVIKIPTPKNVAKATIQGLAQGRAKYEPQHSAIIWRMKKFTGDAEYTLYADVELASTVSEKSWTRPPISLDFQVPMFTASGLRVRFLKVHEKNNYKPVKWIRYVTKAGQYQHRI